MWIKNQGCDLIDLDGYRKVVCEHSIGSEDEFVVTLLNIDEDEEHLWSGNRAEVDQVMQAIEDAILEDFPLLDLNRSVKVRGLKAIE